MSTEYRGNLYKVVDNTAGGVRRAQEASGPDSIKDRFMPFLRTPMRGARWLLFYIMMWIRPLFQLATRAVAIPSLLVALLAFVVNDTARPALPYIFIGVSFGAFLLGWFYDSLILAISPNPIILS